MIDGEFPLEEARAVFVFSQTGKHTAHAFTLAHQEREESIAAKLGKLP